MTDPHAGQPVLHHGMPIDRARLVVILVHGRGGSPEDMLGLAAELNVSDVAYLAPAAAGGTWYPQSFLAPIDQNEPGLSSALAVLERLVSTLAQQGVTDERVALLGFSQGACLALEFAARRARRYAAVVALSGGLIGPPGTPRPYGGTFESTPVFLGCSDIDTHSTPASARVGRCVPPAQGLGRRAHLSAHGTHGQPRGDRRGHRAARQRFF